MLISLIVIFCILLLFVLAGICAPAMAQNAYAQTFGTTFFHGTAGGAATTPLAGIDKIRAGVKKVVAKIDISRIDQASRVRQKSASMIEPGVLQLTFGFSKTLVTTLEGFGSTTKSWKIVYSDGSNRTFDGFIDGIGDQFEEDGEALFEVDIAVSGDSVFTPAA